MSINLQFIYTNGKLAVTFSNVNRYSTLLKQRMKEKEADLTLPLSVKIHWLLFIICYSDKGSNLSNLHKYIHVYIYRQVALPYT